MFGGSSSINIGITMFLRDQFSRPAQSVAANATALQKATLALADTRQQRNLYAGKAFAGAAALREMGKAVGTAADFGYKMKMVGAVTNATSEQLGTLSIQVKQLSMSTMFFAKDIGEAMNIFAKAGLTAKQISETIDASVFLAGATQSDMAQSAEGINQVLHMFHIPFQQAMRASDMITTSVLGANIGLSDFMETMKYAGATANNLAIPLEKISALTMILGNSGIKGSMAGTGIDNMLRYLTIAIGKDKGKRRDALTALGLNQEDLVDAKGNLKDIGDILKKMATNAGAMGNVVKNTKLLELFGVRGGRPGMVFSGNMADYSKFLSELSNSQGRAKNTTESMMESMKGKILIMQSAWETFMISFGSALEPIIVPMVSILTEVLTTVVKILDTPYLGSFLAGSLAILTAWKTIKWAFLAVRATFKIISLSNQISMASEAATTVSSYNAMTMAAERYNIAAQGGIRGRLLGGLSNLWNGASTKVKQNAAGRWVRNQAGRSGFVGMGPNSLGERYLRMYGPQSGAMRGLGSVVNRALPILARALPFMGAVALAGWSASQNNAPVSDSELIKQKLGMGKDDVLTKEQIAAVQENTRMLQEINNQKRVTGDFQDSYTNAVLKMNALKYEQSGKSGKFYDFGNNFGSGVNTPGELHIYMDGKQVIKEQIKIDSQEKVFKRFGLIS